MLVQLAPAELTGLRSLFAGLEHQLIIQAVLDGTSPGTVYGNDRQQPNALFMRSAEGHILVGDPTDTAFNQALHKLLAGMIFADQEWYFSVYVHPKSWLAALPDIVAPVPIL